MANPIKSRTNTQGKDTQILQGIAKDLQTMSSLFLGGETYTPQSLTTLIQSRIDAANEATTAKAAWQAAGKAYKALSTKVSVVEHDLKQLVIGAFGATSSKLADFGFTPRKKAVLTPEQKVAAAAKRAATRKARGTMGPKAKLGVKGTVTPTPPATTATPAAPTVTTATETAPAAAHATTPATASTTAPVTAPATAPATVATQAPAAAPNLAPSTASAAAPAMNAPTVTVNVTTAPAAAPAQQPVASPATAPEPAQAQPVAPTAAPAAAPMATASAATPGKA